MIWICTLSVSNKAYIYLGENGCSYIDLPIISQNILPKIFSQHCDNTTELFTGAVVNCKKTKLVVFNGELQSPSMGRKQINISDSSKALGVMIDQQLNFKQRLTNCMKSLKATFGMLKPWYPQDSAAQLLNEYSCKSFSPYSFTQLYSGTLRTKCHRLTWSLELTSTHPLNPSTWPLTSLMSRSWWPRRDYR